MFNLIIRGGYIIDGRESPWYCGDIGIQGERIATIGKLDQAEATLVTNAEERVAYLGSIDMH